MATPRLKRSSGSFLRSVFLIASATVFSGITIFRLFARNGSNPFEFNRGSAAITPAMLLAQTENPDWAIPAKKRSSALPDVYDFTGTANQHREVRLETKQSPIGGAFVHVGKTGGSALSILLRNGCHSFLPHPCREVANETLASKLIQSYYHVPDFNFLPQSHHDFYLMTLRDPFERTVSAFTFEHIQNKRARGEGIEPVKIRKLELAYTCFPTLEAYVSYLEGNATDFSYPHAQTKIRMPCQDLARAALFGVVRPFNHFFFNLHHVFSCLPDPAQLTYYVTRQEHLYHDWIRINQDLGDAHVILPAHVDSKVVRNHTDAVVPVTRDLSLKGTLILCQALEQEYKIYFWFLRRARNINESDLQESIDRTKARCPNLPIETYVNR